MTLPTTQLTRRSLRSQLCSTRNELAALNEGLSALLAGDWAGYWSTYPVPLPDAVMQRFEEVNDPKANGAALLALRQWTDTNSSEGLAETRVPRLVYFGTGEVFADSFRSVLAERGVTYIEKRWAGHAETMSDAAGVSTIVKDFLASI